MRVAWLFLLFLGALCSSYAQTPDSVSQQKNVDDRVFTVVEEPAQFTGGYVALKKFLSDSIRYPQEAIKEKIQGIVYIKFIVASNGSISNIALMRGLTPELNEEALRVASLFPPWKPGKQNGKPVNSWFVLPITFSLPKNKR